MLSDRQKAIDGWTVLMARTKSAKELDELLKAAPTNEWRRAVRLAKKLRLENIRWARQAAQHASGRETQS